MVRVPDCDSGGCGFESRLIPKWYVWSEFGRRNLPVKQNERNANIEGSNPFIYPKCLSSSVVRAPTWYVGGHGFVAVYGSNKINASIALVVDCASLVKRNYTSGVRIPLLAQIKFFDKTPISHSGRLHLFCKEELSGVRIPLLAQVVSNLEISSFFITIYK